MKAATNEHGSVCVFCGSSTGVSPAFKSDAVRLGRCLAEKGRTLVYGGGSIGLMGAMARSAMAAGGQVIGIIPENINERIEDIELTEKRVVPTMHDRKAAMYEISDAFIVMPGGLGTMDEFFEIYTWYQLGYHLKPIGILNTEGYYDGLIGFLLNSVQKGFVKSTHLDTLIVRTAPEELIDAVSTFRMSYVDKLAIEHE